MKTQKRILALILSTLMIFSLFSLASCDEGVDADGETTESTADSTGGGGDSTTDPDSTTEGDDVSSDDEITTGGEAVEPDVTTDGESSTEPDSTTSEEITTGGGSVLEPETNNNVGTTPEPETTTGGGTTPEPETTTGGGTTPEPETTTGGGSTPEPEAKPSEGLEFTLNDDGISYSVADIGTCSDTVLVIPSTYKGLPVTNIGPRAFEDCSNLTSVTIPDSVTRIGTAAFRNCTSLASVTIPDGVTGIWNYAFSDCTSLASVTIPDSVTVIENSAFRNCTSLTSVTIGNGVTSIYFAAFANCTSLDAVYISDIAAWCGISFDENNTNPLRYANNLYLNGTLVTDLVIPDGVTSIGSYAFHVCTSLTSVTIPSSVTRIGSGAFNNCHSLTSITIPDSVTSIGKYAFWYCDSLTSVTIGSGVTSIGEQAFFNCTSLDAVYISDIAAWCGISFYNDDANPLYYANNLYLNGTLVTDLVIPDGVTSIGKYAFYSCGTSLVSVTIPDSVTSIGEDAFRYCTNLNAVYISDIAAWCGISFEFDENVAYSLCYANPFHYAEDLYLNGTLVTDLVIPDGVTSIGSYAFYGCESLTSVTIGNGVKRIGIYAFYGCKSLNAVYISDIAAWCGISFGDYYANPLYYVGHFYLNGTIGGGDLVIPDSVTSIGDYAFYGCSLNSVTIPDSVTSIGEEAFRYCGLTCVMIGSGVTSIGGDAFGSYLNQDHLASITVAESNPNYKSIDGNLYSKDGSELIRYAPGKFDTAFVISDSVTSIGSGAFLGCTSLTSITIPDSVTSICEYAFNYCTSLTSVTFEGTTVEWNAISKGSGWKYNAPFTVVHCSDGDVNV